MSLYQLFKTDKNLEKDGIWLEYGMTDDQRPIRIKIARAGGSNTAYSKALEKAARPHRKAIQTQTLDNKVADAMYKGVFAETVVLDWENVEFPVKDDEGNVTGMEARPYSKDNALQLFNDLPDLFLDLREQAANVSLFREEILETDLGNSGKSSATASSKAR